MIRPYSVAFKQKMIEQLTGKDAVGDFLERIFCVHRPRRIHTIERQDARGGPRAFQNSSSNSTSCAEITVSETSCAVSAWSGISLAIEINLGLSLSNAKNRSCLAKMSCKIF